MRSREVVECCGRDVFVDMLDMQRWLIRGGIVDSVHELRGGLLPAELWVELVWFVPRGLVLRHVWSRSGDGCVRGGPVLGVGCDGLQRLRERLLPRCRRSGLVYRLLERTVQRGFFVEHGLLDLRGGLLPARHGRGELRQLSRG